MHGFLNGHFISKFFDPQPLKSLCWWMLCWGKSDLCVLLIPGHNLCHSPPAPLTATAIRISGFSLSRCNSGHHRALSWADCFLLISQPGRAGRSGGLPLPHRLCAPSAGLGVRSNSLRRPLVLATLSFRWSTERVRAFPWRCPSAFSGSGWLCGRRVQTSPSLRRTMLP